MNFSKILKLSIFLTVFLGIFSISFASVEVFSDYSTHLKINDDDTIEINKSLTLKNVYTVGIVPGQIEFKIAKGTEGSLGNIEIQEVRAIDAFGKEINSQIRTSKEFSVIIVDVYYPLLPGFEYEFDLYYKLSYNPGGIFFKSLQIPIRESTIPIEKGTFTVELPESYHFTYLESEGSQGEIIDNQAQWEIKDNTPSSILFEYSYLPVSIGNFQGSYLFWILVNIVLVVFLVIEIRREVKRIKQQYGE
jgi:hypothetical protein